MPKPFLRSLAELEGDLLVFGHRHSSEDVKSKFERKQSAQTKQIFLFVGEPRTGKTTLADYANISRFARHIDTDGFQTERLQAQLQKELDAFFLSEEVFLCLITFGLHRYVFDQIWNALKSEHSECFNNIHVTICRFERG